MKYYEKNYKKQTVCNLRLGAFGPSKKTFEFATYKLRITRVYSYFAAAAETAVCALKTSVGKHDKEHRAKQDSRTFHCQKLIWLNQENFLILSPTKPKGVTIQLKALDEYFLIVVFTLLLQSFCCCKFYVWLEQRNMADNTCKKKPFT